ncbi:MAG: 1-acyl-sn-glycerol-3-phosphate acyltransferase [Chloroflexi bacterium]|nr:1-acyl-sn-glycerol-3-phosphate acyltransferase [Chloroflexota bacterium]
MKRPFLYHLLRAFVYLVLRVLIKLTIVGRENLPDGDEPLIIIGNHFSLVEGPIIGLHLPYDMTFFAAAELQKHPFIRLLYSLVDVILVHRNQADRAALRQASEALAQGKQLLIMPEGGIDPAHRDALASGQETSANETVNSRLSAELIPPRPGSAYLAVRSGARIVPVAILGGEQVLDNARRLRRTKVTMRIGPPFGPLQLDLTLRGAARRQQIDEYGHEMMRRIAALMPPENRGPYREIEDGSSKFRVKRDS